MSSWTPQQFEAIVATGKFYNPFVIWEILDKNPVTGVATSLARKRVAEDPERYLRALTLDTLLDQVRLVRPDLVPLSQSVAGRAWMQAFLDGFKQVLCKEVTGHNGYVVQEGNRVRCRLCGMTLPVAKPK